MSVNQCTLTFQDESNDVNDSVIVVFQQNENPDYNSEAIAWQVLKDLGKGMCRDVVYPYDLELRVQDYEGNYTCPPVSVSDGDFLKFVNASGHVLKKEAGQSSNPEEVQCLNALPTGSIDISMYRGGKLLDLQPNVEPQGMAVFRFLPKIYCAVVSNITEGDVIDAATVMRKAQEIPLTGISAATIRLTGGGKGASATAFNFEITKKQTF